MGETGTDEKPQPANFAEALRQALSYVREYGFGDDTDSDTTIEEAAESFLQVLDMMIDVTP